MLLKASTLIFNLSVFLFIGFELRFGDAFFSSNKKFTVDFQSNDRGSNLFKETIMDRNSYINLAPEKSQDILSSLSPASLALLKTNDSLDSLMQNMPISEKYSLLLQSYATSIMEDSDRTMSALNTMENLYLEMLSKAITPSSRSSKLLIDASSTFCSSIVLGKSLQLSKAG